MMNQETHHREDPREEMETLRPPTSQSLLNKTSMAKLESVLFQRRTAMARLHCAAVA